MAAYAALVSVMHIIQQIEDHPRPPIFLDEKQSESLTKNVTFLQEFLEGYPSIGKNEGDDVESRILDAANAAEDVIESHIVDRLHAGSTNHADEVEFGQRLQKVIEDMDLIKNEVVETKEKMAVPHQLQRKSTSSSTVQMQNTTMVEYDDPLGKILDKLTRGSDRQIIPIVGMGGMGKTTLAQNVLKHPLIREHFKIIIWAKVSQEYDAIKILGEILSQAKQDQGNSREKNLKRIRNDLYQYLFEGRYLIVIDDMWSIDVWNEIKFFFPDIYNGSRIVVTTRLSNLARQLSDSFVQNMRFLDMDESWNLFSRIVFPKDGYPPEMVEMGKKIVGKCKGLPLSIVVVGVYLANSEYRRDHWKHIEENLASFVNSHNDERCLKMLRLSYDQLPVHLKPCFLYMGLFEEDNEIHISKLVKLWVAEGFLKPVSGKDMEHVAKDYLNDLVDRNLIFIMESKRNCIQIHDLLRDLSSRQAQAERFYIVLEHGVPILNHHRRFIVSPTFSDEEVRSDALLSMTLARSMICYSSGIRPSANHRLLRICGAWYGILNIADCFHEGKFQLVNLRYLSSQYIAPGSKLATSLHLLWSLQTLIIEGSNSDGFTAPAEIWNMSQLKHVDIKGYLYIPDPPAYMDQDDVVLENLQTLKLVRNFKCSKEVVKRIPRIKKLGLEYVGDEIEGSYLHNLRRLKKLKSFKCISHSYPQPDGTDLLHKLSFPRLLKKLALDSAHTHWEDLLEKIGSLPFLEKLKLKRGFFPTRAWETVEGHFPSLKFLKIDSCADLEHWNPERSHFPCLEHLVLCELLALNEIPSGTVDMTTLKSIEVIRCNQSIITSCKRIQEEREDLYGEDDVTFLVNLDASHMEANDLLHLEGPKFKFSIRNTRHCSEEGRRAQGRVI